MTMKDDMKKLDRAQLIEFLTELASDDLLRWLVMSTILAPLRKAYHRLYGKCDVSKCQSMAMYSGNAHTGAPPLRCSAHRAASDSGIAFAAEIEWLAKGMSR